MNVKMGILWVTVIAAGVFCPGYPTQAGDTDDGISIEDGIPVEGSVKSPDKNINYIVLRAKSRAESSSEEGLVEGGDVVQGGVILREGAQDKDITVIYEGSNNVVVGR